MGPSAVMAVPYIIRSVATCGKKASTATSARRYCFANHDAFSSGLGCGGLACVKCIEDVNDVTMMGW
eukprot:scaffold345813_cov53-Prasinocladus_malaysianus.AAC.1